MRREMLPSRRRRCASERWKRGSLDWLLLLMVGVLGVGGAVGLEVARPTSLPPPPCGHETSNHRGNDSHRVSHRPPRFTLCSVAIGEPYESRLEQLRFSAAAAGFDRTLLWKRSDVLADPLFQQSNISAAFDVMDAFFRRYHHKK